MVNIIPKLCNYLKDCKCGDVFYTLSNSYEVGCEVCGLRISFDTFTDHFRDHLNDLNKATTENGAQVELEPPIKIEPDCDDDKEWQSSDDEPLVSLQDPLLKVETEFISDAESEHRKPNDVKRNAHDEADHNCSKKEKNEQTETVSKPSESTNKTERRKDRESGDDEQWLRQEDDQEDMSTNEESDPETDGVNLESKFTCDVCSKPCHSFKGLAIHKGRAHLIRKIKLPKAKKEFKCVVCKEIFETGALLRAHEDEHTDVTCNLCNKKFKHIKYLERHKIRHTAAKTIKCTVCDKMFYTITDLRSHMHIHTGKPIVCEECGKTFRDSSLLRQHKRRHTNERPFKCSSCGKGYYTQADLNLHMSTHSKDRPHACDVCGKTYTRKYCLRIHKKTHTSYRPFKCTMCGKDFMAAHGIKSHMRIHGMDGFAKENQSLISAAAAAAAAAAAGAATAAKKPGEGEQDALISSPTQESVDSENLT